MHKINDLQGLFHWLPFRSFGREETEELFDGGELNFDRSKVSWFQILSCLIKGHPTYSCEDLGNLIDSLLDI